ncbi:hypothetical protein J1N35_011959 [Gossypium stocksii]|uniref:Uncharacterized protein n=1 Tax=Gossypium stocksii TaxID=47602 RepID=A0A9D3W3C8_9ROSI|nr:hypothetical protein J1N35_011959 [Gossypium stocksii]
MDVEGILDTHCSSGNVILELYALFVDVEEGGLSLTTVLINLFWEQETESPTKQLCDGFMVLLQKSYQEMLESLMGRNSSVSALDFNFGIQLGLVGNPNLGAPTRNFFSAFHFNFQMLMFYVGNTYAGMPPSYTGLMRMDDVLPTTCTDEGISNPEPVTGVDNEKKAKNKEEYKIDDDPIQESGPDGSRITLFFEVKVVPTEGGSGYDGNGPNNTEGTHPDFTTYAPHKTLDQLLCYKIACRKI